MNMTYRQQVLRTATPVQTWANLYDCRPLHLSSSPHQPRTCMCARQKRKGREGGGRERGRDGGRE